MVYQATKKRLDAIKSTYQIVKLLKGWVEQLQNMITIEFTEEEKQALHHERFHL